MSSATRPKRPAGKPTPPPASSTPASWQDLCAAAIHPAADLSEAMLREAHDAAVRAVARMDLGGERTAVSRVTGGGE